MVYLDKHLKKYPLMQVQDILKLHLQGILGPTHLIKDIDRLKSNLLNEYSECKDADIVVVFGGTNDYGHENGGELGEVDSIDDYTFNGALNNLITNLKKDYPNSLIIFLTPLHRVNDDVSLNGTGNVLRDYVNTIIAAAKRHNVYLIDLFNELNLDPHDKSLFPDGLHPNNDGHSLLANFLIKKLLEL